MNERDFTLLDDYFNGLLSPEDAEAVRKRTRTDAEFGREYELRQHMEAYPRRAMQRKEFADTLTAAGVGYFQANKEKGAEDQSFMSARVNRRRWLLAAASLALAAAAIWFVAQPGDLSYRKYAQHEPLSLTLRGEADQAASEAETAFNAQDYALALPALNRFLAEQPGDPTAQLYKGICLVELGRPAEARAVLEPIAAGASALRNEAVWYTALSYLKEKNTSACKAELLKIPPEDARYGQAQGLLGKIK